MKKNRMTTKIMVLCAILIAISIIIPMYFGFLRVIIPPFFTATIAAHVPMVIAMLISPSVAVVVGAGSALGFFMASYGPVVVIRATSHIVWGYIGAKMLNRGNKFAYVTLITGIIHGIYEGLVIIPFIMGTGKALLAAVAVTAVGTVIHHFVDSAITYPIASALKLMDKKNMVKKHPEHL